ncbi:MAG: SDR family NAD(P)-dependent oxidoreductase [Pseudomonadota bacterium]
MTSRIPKTAPAQPDLSSKTALVTGASRGIGRAAALTLAKAGAHVIALARTVGGLEELDDEIKALGGTASLVPADLGDDKAIDQLGPALSSRFASLDILVANAAALGELAPLPDIAPSVWTKTIDTNITANWRMLRTLDPLLRASGDGRVVYLTSRVGGAEARAFWGLYAATKAAGEMIAKTYALEAKIAGVKVAIVDPGAMRTKMRAQAMPGENPESLPHPDEIAPLLHYALGDDFSADEIDGAARLVFRDWKAAGLV